MKKIKLLIITLFIILISGCSSYTELNDLGIVSILGIDYQENNYHLYINIIEGNQDDGSLEKEYITYDAKGETIDQAFHHLYLQSNKKIYLSHMDNLLLTENAINQNLKEIITYLLNQKEIRNNFEVTQINSNLEKIFTEKIEAKEINDLIKTNQLYMGTTSSITFEEFLEELLIDQNSFLPKISFENNLEIQGLSLIKNFKTFNALSPDETILLNILKNNINQTIYNKTTIYKQETTTKYEKDKVTFQINLETNNVDENLNENLKQDLKSLLYFYQCQNYDLIKLEYKMKQNYLFNINSKNVPIDKLKFKIEITTKVHDNYMEKELPTDEKE